MVNYCRVIGCHNRSDREKSLHYYRLPTLIKNQGEETEKLSADRRRMWIASLNQDFSGKNLENIRICSSHFQSGKKAALYEKENPDWCPSLLLKPTSPRSSTSILSPAMLRHRRRLERFNNKTTSAAALSLLQLNESMELPDGTEETGNCVQTELTSDLIDSMTGELQKLRTENIHLRDNILSKFETKDFEGRDDKVLYFTGLPKYTLLISLFNFLEPHLTVRKTLTKFQMLILTFIRLRLNMSISFLAYEFDVSVSTVSRIFTDCIDVMYVRLKHLVFWPPREQLYKTMPMQFRKDFGKRCAVIIDCFEVFVERPSNLQARAETWSSYKHHNTVKFLIGITPQGMVSYISKAWGGRTSDKHLTINCNFLDNLLPGDIILADRGFDIQDCVGSMMAECKIPAFTKGKSQLGPVDLETTRKIAHVRIHVERVIGLVRQKYQILSGTLPLELLICKGNENVAPIDKIGHICCSLVNLCESVIDFN